MPTDTVTLPSAAVQPALCVDLDGTLVKSDTLVDSFFVLARQKPALLLQLPGWLLKGKAYFKARLAEQVELDVANLPYNRPLMAYLQEQYATGRHIYLATASDRRPAERIAAEIGIFRGVLASDGVTNLKGEAKLRAFQQMFAEHGFDYIGNASPDLTLLRASATPMVANPDVSLSHKLRSAKITPARVFQDRRSFVRASLKAIRPHQWAKNVLIFLPMLLAHHVTVPLVLAGLLAFVAFGLAASTAYVVNDLLDIEADRRHPKKSRRPFASADLSPTAGMGIVICFLAGAFVLAHELPGMFLFWLTTYFASTMLYSLVLKRLVLIDVITLSGLYTLRILAGSAATGVIISPWLGAFSIFLFLSLAMVKRFAELTNLRAQNLAPANGRGYVLADIEQIRSFGTAAGYGAVIIFILYINNVATTALYRHPPRMWLMAPLMIWWISRVWLLASRGELDEDPITFALTDRTSFFIGLLMFAVALLAL